MTWVNGSLRCLYITMFPCLMLLFVNWFMPYSVVITIVLMFWLINCLHQTFILSLNYLNVGASYCTNVVFCCFFNLFSYLHSLLYSHCSWAQPAIGIKWSEVDSLGHVLFPFARWQHDHFANVIYLFFYFFLWPPYFSTHVNGGSRNFHIHVVDLDCD